MEKEIKHKELLTFSNLTNLEWQFVNLDKQDTTQQDKKTNSKLGNISSKSIILKDLLDPESFIREETNPETGETKEKYVYMDHLTDDDIIRIDDRFSGLQKMRRAAGIAMEYLEHSQTGKDKDERMTTEGSFLNDREVIYGADNYKVVADYLDYLYSKQPEKLKELSQEISTTKGSAIKLNVDSEKPYPTREELDDMEDTVQTVKTITTLVKVGTTIVFPATIRVMHSSSVLDFRKAFSLENKMDIIAKATKSILNNSVEFLEIDLNDISKLTNSKGLKLLGNQGMQRGMDKYLKSKEKELEHINEQDIENLENLKGLEDNPEIQLSKKLDMSDTGFRVLVLKNEKTKEIVISFKSEELDSEGKEKNKEILPKERDMILLVYDKILRDGNYKGYEIKLTGINCGADLSFLSSVIYEDSSTLFYTKKPSAAGYLSFDKDDIDPDYDTGIEIVQKNCEDILTKDLWKLIPYIVAGSSVWVPILAILGLGIKSIIQEMFKDFKVDRIYERLMEWGYLTDEDEIRKEPI
ncbi:MAG: hypothetical protein ACQERZ_06625 [Fusobacteriota bacterium]